MNFSKWKFLIAMIIIVSLVLWYYLFQIVSLVLDFQVIMKMDFDSPQPVAKAKYKPYLPIIDGLIPEKAIPSSVKYQSLPFIKSSREVVSDKKFAESRKEILKEIPPEYFQKLEKEIPGRVETAFRSIPFPPKAPNRTSINSPIPYFRKAVEGARAWYIFGRKSAIEGKGALALQTMCGILLYSQMFEADSAEGLLLITKMIGISLRNTGSVGLLEILPKIALSRDETTNWTKRLLLVEERTPSMALAIKCESLMIPSIFDPAQLPKYRKQMKGRVPARLINAIGDKALQKEYLSPFFDPQIEACGQPYPVAMKTVSKTQHHIDQISKKITTPGFHWIIYFFQPERCIMQMLMTISLPNCGRALDGDFRCRQTFRGAIVALSLRGFENNHRKLPSTLKELEDWVDAKMPLDVYSLKPLEYHPKKKKILYSVGPDGMPDTSDDLVFVPLE